MISPGTKTTQSGWVDIEEIESVPDIPLLHTVGSLVTKTGASNVCNVLRDLKTLDGYKVRVTVEVLDTPDNRTDAEKLPRPADHYSAAAIKARHITDTLDKIEADGRFDGMSDDEKETERQMIGTRLKQDMEDK